jgi:hypothetical protein
MTELTMCECGHPAIYHFAHGRCGMDQMYPPVFCMCFNLVPTTKDDQ